MVKNLKLKSSLNFQLVIFIAVRIVLNTALRMINPFLSGFEQGLRVDLVILGRVLALRSTASILGPLLAWQADRRGRKFGMLLGVGIFTTSLLVMAIFPSFFSFVLVIILTALGIFIFNPSMQAYLGDHVPYEQRGRVLSLSELGWSLSFIIGIPIIGFLISKWGWSAPFPVLASLGILSIIFLAIILPKDIPLEEPKSNPFRSIVNLFKSPAVISGLLMGGMLSMANELVALIFGVWLEGSFGLEIAALGITAALIGCSELAGELLSAGITDRIGKFTSITSGILMNCLAAAFLMVFGGGIYGAIAGLLLFFLSFEFTVVSSIPVMTETAPTARATFMACYVAALSLGRAAGDLLTPKLLNLGDSISQELRMTPILIGVMVLNAIALLALKQLRRNLRISDSGIPLIN